MINYIAQVLTVHVLIATISPNNKTHCVFCSKSAILIAILPNIYEIGSRISIVQTISASALT